MVNKSIQELIKQIEKVRKEMIDLSIERSLTDPGVIEISQKLDLLLNELEYLMNKQT